MPQAILTPNTKTARRGVLLVHGFGGDRRQYQPAIRYLRQHGCTRFYEFTYWQKYGQVPMAEIARQLDEFVKTNIQENQIDCIAISQGGIIARWYIQHYDGQKILRCVTLCAPHHGSWLAYLLPSLGALDLRPNSQLLRELEATQDHTTYYSVYTPFDLMVVPGWSGRLPHARRNWRVWSLAHPLVFRSRATLRFIGECFTAP